MSAQTRPAIFAFQGELYFPVKGVDEGYLPSLYRQQQQKLAGTSQLIIMKISKVRFKTTISRNRVSCCLGSQRPNERKTVE